MKRILASMMIISMLFLQSPVSALASESNDTVTMTIQDDSGEWIEVELSMSEKEITIQQNREGYFKLHEIWVNTPGVEKELLDFDWSCEETNVVELLEGPTRGSAMFSPVGLGEAMIKVVCNGEAELYCHVTVIPAEPVNDTIPITMYQGTSVYFYDYDIGFENGIETCDSDNEAVAVVNQDGRITAVGEGVANITLASDCNESATFFVTVRKAVVVGETKLYWGESGTFTWDGFEDDVEVSYQVFGQPVVTVDEFGRFIGCVAGECAIIAEAKGYDPVVLIVAVKKNTLKVKKNAVKMYTGESLNLKAKVSPEDIPITYSFDKENVVKIDETGTITGVGPGLVTITVAAKGAEPVEVTVRVVKDKLDTPKVKLSHNGKGINLSWNKVSYAEDYLIYRKEGNGKWNEIALISSATRKYVDTKIKLNQTYDYKIKAIDVAYGLYRESEYSNVVSKKISKLQAPMDFKVKRAGYKSIKISWSRVYPASGYEIYRSKSGKAGSFVKVKTVNKASTLTYKNTNLTPGQKYYYKVRAFCSIDDKIEKRGVFSAVKSSTPNFAQPKIKKNTYTTNSTIKISWNKVSYADGYYIYRKTTNGSWKKVGSVKGNKTFSYKDNPAAGVYLYSIKAYGNVNGKKVFSPRSEPVKSRTLKAPKVSVTAANDTEFKAKVTWSKVTGATGYKVYRRNAGGSWKCAKTVSASTRIYTASVPHGTKVDWKVRAVYNKTEGTAYGAYSKTVPIQLSYIPHYKVEMGQKSRSDVRYITITIKNKGKETMYIGQEAAIKDAAKESYDRDLVLYNKEAATEVLSAAIIPGGSVKLTYKVIGNKTRYTSKTMLAFMFEYDNVNYVGVSTAEKGDICIDIEKYMNSYQ